MKKLLIVRAHPYGSDRSRSMQLADAFLAGFRETHPDALVEDINLYTAAVPEIDIDLLSGWEQLHDGEEFIYILSGKVVLHTEHYEPVLLLPGDSCYFASAMGHALVNGDTKDAEVLWVCSHVDMAHAVTRGA